MAVTFGTSSPLVIKPKTDGFDTRGPATPRPAAAPAEAAGPWAAKAGGPRVDTGAPQSLDAALTLAGNFQRLRGSDRAAARTGLSDFFSKNPAQLDQLLATGSPADKQNVARAVFQGFLDKATPNTGNYQRMVKLAEAMDPNAKLGDLTRALRQQYYGDDMLQLAGFGMGDAKPNLSPELKSMIDGAGGALKKKWQEIPGPDGQPVDIAHSLVALDAQENNPGVNGKVRAWVFTDFGDWATGVLSKLGATGAGDDNPTDQRGNDFGGQLMKSQRTAPAASLSALLSRNLQPDAFLKR